MQKTLLRFGRWLVHKLSIALLANAVAVAVVLYAIGAHITSANTFKGWLNDSNSYENIINESINLIEVDSKSASTDGSLGDSLEANPFIEADTVIQALKETLDPSFIQSE